MANGGSMDEHMAGHVEAKMSKLANMKPSVLDSFTKLTSNIQKQRIFAGTSIITHILQSKTGAENVNDELLYALNRLVRGMGSSRLNSRAGFFSTLVCLLTKLRHISATHVLDSVKKELQIGSGKSKSEISEASTGQILAYGALIHSGLLMQATTEEQKEVLSKLIEAGKRKSYLTLVATTFIVNLLEKVDELFVKNVLWPILKAEIGKPWCDQTLESLYILLIMQSKYPAIVKSKFIEKKLGTPTIIHMDTLSECLHLLMNMPMLTTIQHPIYEEFCKHLVKSDILASFWLAGIDKQLEKSNYNKELLILKMVLCILRNVEDKSEIPKLLTPRFSDFIRKSFLYKKGKNEIIMKLREFLNLLVSTMEGDDVSDNLRLKVVQKLLLHPDDFSLERRSGTKVIQLLSRQLKADGAKKLAKMFHKVISATENNNPKPWKNCDRQLAASLLIRIMAHPELQGDLEWREKQCQLLIDYSLFNSHSVGENSDQNIGPRLADNLKECFFRALDQRLPKLHDLRLLLSSIVKYINDKLIKKEISLRQPLSEQSSISWNKMLELVKKMEKHSEDEQCKLRSISVIPVFHTMFLLMGLHLFSNPTLAQEALQELHSCYERSVNMKMCTNKDEDAEEPHWVEVAVDLMLSLLSHDSHLLRSLVSCVFPHLCTHLTPAAFHHIIQVLDPNSDQSPLSELDEDDSETDDEEENSGDESEKSDESGDSDVFEDDEETVNDKLRMAVRQALGTAASLTDTESVDMDEMDEEEGKRLDAALSEAFCLLKKTKPKKSKKQSKEDEELTHFRVRVIGLLKKYLSGEPDLALCLDLIIPLFELLEFCIKDPHQKPLEDTVGGCLKFLSSIKKFSNVEGVTKQTIVTALQRLLDKGQRTAPIYIDMGDKITMCATFLVRCSEHSQIVDDLKIEKKKRKTVEKTMSVSQLYQNSLEAFFKKRECLLQQNLFKSVLQIKWEGNWTLAPSLVAYAFDADVRPFKRNQALDLLMTFNQNRRLLNNLSPEKLNILKNIDIALSSNSVTILETLPTPTNCDNAQDTAIGSVKQKFICELIQLLFCIYQSRKKLNLDDNMDWKQISSALACYRDNVDLSTDTKIAFNKLSKVLGLSSLKSRRPDKKSIEINHEPNHLHNTEETENEVENENAENGMAEEISSKKRKRKSKSHNNMKKQTKKLRISALSEGLEDVSFSKLNYHDSSVESQLQTKSFPNVNTKLKPSKKKNCSTL